MGNFKINVYLKALHVLNLTTAGKGQNKLSSWRTSACHSVMLDKDNHVEIPKQSGKWPKSAAARLYILTQLTSATVIQARNYHQSWRNWKDCTPKCLLGCHNLTDAIGLGGRRHQTRYPKARTNRLQLQPERRILIICFQNHNYVTKTDG